MARAWPATARRSRLSSSATTTVCTPCAAACSGNEADAVDAAQDALLSAVRAITRFDGRSSFGTWLYRIATNASLDELRRRRRRPVVGLPAEVDDDWDRPGPGGPAPGAPAPASRRPPRRLRP